jgi:hypothetical protein
VIIPDSLGNDKAPLFIEYRLFQKPSVPITLASLIPDQERLISYLFALSIMAKLEHMQPQETAREAHLLRKLRREGVALFYEEAGGGELSLIFVHGGAATTPTSPPSLSTSVVSTASWRSTCAVPALYIAADEPQPRTDIGRFHELVP